MQFKNCIRPERSDGSATSGGKVEKITERGLEDAVWKETPHFWGEPRSHLFRDGKKGIKNKKLNLVRRNRRRENTADTQMELLQGLKGRKSYE